jgi:hypothetical protein
MGIGTLGKRGKYKLACSFGMNGCPDLSLLLARF